MRILYLSPSEPYPGTHAGFTHVHNLIKHLVIEGDQVTLIAGQPEQSNATTNDEMRPDPIPGLKVHHISSSDPITRNRKLLAKVVSLCKKEQFDLIHERFEMAGTAGAVAAKLAHLPLVLEVNDPFLELNAQPSFRYPLSLSKQLQFGSADALICQTPQIKQAIWDTSPNTKVYVIPNGADPDAFPASPLPHTKRIGFMGNFMPWHGVQHLIQAFSRVQKEDEDTQLLLVGNPGSQKDPIQRLINELGIDPEKVIMTGPVPSNMVPTLLSSCRILVAPFAPGEDVIRKDHYAKYGFWWSPIKLFEYMSLGRPVVAADVGMVSKYLKHAGLTYPTGDIEQLTEKIITFLNDEPMAREAGGRGRKRIETSYNWRTIAHMTQMAYLNVLEKRDRVV